MNKIKKASLVLVLSLLLFPSLAIAQTQRQNYPLAPKDAATIKDIQGQNLNNPQAPANLKNIRSNEDINRLLKTTGGSEQKLVVSGAPAKQETKPQRSIFPWPLIVLWLIVMITPLVAIIKLLKDLKEEKQTNLQSSNSVVNETVVSNQKPTKTTKKLKKKKKSKRRY